MHLLCATHTLAPNSYPCTHIRKAELGRVERKLTGLSAPERETVERLTKGIVAKLLHGPMSHLRSMDESGTPYSRDPAP